VARRGFDLRQLLTFGGQAPQAAGELIAAMVVTTIVGALVPGVARLLPLVVPATGFLPELAQVWRLATWPFLQPIEPLVVLTLLFAGVSLVWLGRQLSSAWSERRFLVRFFAITILAGLASELALLPFDLPFAYAGMWPVVNGLLVTWGLTFPRQRLSWFGAVQMSGAAVARLFFIGTPVYALVLGQSSNLLFRFLEFAPHLATIGAAWLLATGGPRRALHRLTSWWQARRLASAKRRFKVIDPGKPPREYLN